MSTLRSEGRRRRLAFTAALLLATALAGCTVNRHEIVGSVPDDYRTRHPIVLEESLATLDIPTGVDIYRLAAPMRANIAGFAQTFLDSGGTTLAIIVPTGSANAAASRHLAGDIRTALVRSGVPNRAIEFRAYAAGPSETGAPVRLAYNRIAAGTDRCGDWPDQTAANSENRNYENFGCASQQNLAAMLDNPLDLLYPRKMTPADATRRSTVLAGTDGKEGFQNGKYTGTDYSGAPGGDIATTP